MTELLTFDEILRVSRIAVANGIEKIRLTGGEPLLRKGIENLVAQLAALRTPARQAHRSGHDDERIASHQKAQALKDAGLGRITVSLDGIDEDIFQSFNDVGYPPRRYSRPSTSPVRWVSRSRSIPLSKGVNEGEILKICEVFRGTGVTPRFIEYMDVGNANDWRMDEVVPSREVVARIAQRWPVESLSPTAPGETCRTLALLGRRRRSSASSAPSREPSAVPAHACASQWKGAFTSVFCLDRLRPAHHASRRLYGQRTSDCHRPNLVRARRPLLGTAFHGSGAESSESRNELYWRLMPPPIE